MAPTITFLGEGTSTSLGTTLDSASITATAGRPLIVHFGTSNLVFDASAVTLDPTGTPQVFTRLEREQADDANDCTGEVWVLDSPSTVTAIVRVTHQNNASSRFVQVMEVTGHDTSTSTSWRDAMATPSIVTSGTTHEVTVTSAVGDLPLAFASIRQTSSAPNLTNNGDTTTVDNVLGGTTIRGRVLSGTGAASITLGGTTASATQSVVMGFNVNAAAAGGGGVNLAARAQAMLRAATRVSMRAARVAQLQLAQAAQRAGAFYPGGTFGISNGTGIVGGVSASSDRHGASRLRRARRKR